MLSGIDHGASTDWTKALSRDSAITHNHNVAISGSHKNFSYRASINYKDAEGIAINNGRDEITAKLAADQKCLNGWLKLQYDVSYMHYRNDYSSAYYTLAAQLNPTMPIYDETSPNGELLRPHIVFFGEAVPMFDKARELVKEADILVVVGTSLAVYPAASLVGWVKDNNVPIYVVDPSVPKIPYLRNPIHHIKERAAVGVPQLKEELIKKYKG